MDRQSAERHLNLPKKVSSIPSIVIFVVKPKLAIALPGIYFDKLLWATYNISRNRFKQKEKYLDKREKETTRNGLQWTKSGWESKDSLESDF